MPNPFESGNLAWFWYESWLAGIVPMFALAALIHARLTIRSRAYSASLQVLFVIGFIGALPLAVERLGLNLGGQEEYMAVLSFIGAAGAAIYAVLRFGAVRLFRLVNGSRASATGTGVSVTNGARGADGSIATGGIPDGTGSSGMTSFGGPSNSVPAWLHFRSGPAAGQSVPLSAGVTRLGRDHSNDIVINDPNVSRNHAEIEFRGGQYRLRDAGSSGGTMLGYELESPYTEIAAAEYDSIPQVYPILTHLDPVRPNSICYVSKVFGEVLGRMYSDQHGISSLNIRFGAVLADDVPELRRHYSGYLSHADAVQIVELCIDAPDDLRYDIFEAASDNRWRWRDISHTQKVLGYRPQGSADVYDIEDKGGRHQVNMT